MRDDLVLDQCRRERVDELEVAQVVEHRSAPLGQRILEVPAGLLELACRRRLHAGVLVGDEPADVAVGVGDRQPVTGRRAGQHRLRRRGRRRPTSLRRLETYECRLAFGSGGGNCSHAALTSDVAADRAIAAHHQHREHRPLLGRAQRQRRAVGGHLQRAEYADSSRCTITGNCAVPARFRACPGGVDLGRTCSSFHGLERSDGDGIASRAVGDRRRRHRRDQGRARASRPRTGRLLGALGGQERQGRRRTRRRASRWASPRPTASTRSSPSTPTPSIYSPLMPNPDEVAALLRSGKNVVTPVGWFYPGDKEAAPLRAAALEGSVTLHGTGIAPGGISDKFPLLFSIMSTGVTFVRAEEFSDLRTYDAPDVLRYVMGFGDTPEKALTGPMQKLLDGGFIQSVKMMRRRAWASTPTRRSAPPRRSPSPPRRSTRRWAPSSPGRWPAASSTGRPSSATSSSSASPSTGSWVRRTSIPPWTFGPAGERYEMEVKGNPDFTVDDQGLSARERRGGPREQQRHRRHRGALRELDPRGVCGRAGHRHLPRPAADQWQGGAAPARD